MIKDRTTQLIYQTIYCTLGIVGFFASLGIFDDITMFRWDFYVHFTALSNFLCIVIMFATLIQTVKKREDGFVTIPPALKFLGLMSILLTFLVFNILLAGAEGRDPQLNWRIGSILFHVVLPIMYILEWFLFYERKKMKWFHPFIATVFPLAYVAYIFIQATIMNFDTSLLIPGTSTPFIYPYFFLNLETQGVGGVAKWVVILYVAYVIVGFIFFAIDKLGKQKKSI